MVRMCSSVTAQSLIHLKELTLQLLRECFRVRGLVPIPEIKRIDYTQVGWLQGYGRAFACVTGL